MIAVLSVPEHCLSFYFVCEKVSTLIGYLLNDGNEGLVLKLVSFPVYLGCYALHYGIMYVSRLYILYIQIVC